MKRNVIITGASSGIGLGLKKYFESQGDRVFDISKTNGEYTCDVKNFEDMVDIEEEIKSPILYYEVEEGSEALFTIVNDNYMYRYILKK